VSTDREAKKPKGYCKWCGFAIEKTEVPTGRQFFGPFWRTAWVHTGDGKVSCMWNATPKSHRKPERTLYEQILDAQFPRKVS
jgi:hypothetical protein